MGKFDRDHIQAATLDELIRLQTAVAEQGDTLASVKARVEQAVKAAEAAGVTAVPIPVEDVPEEPGARRFQVGGRWYVLGADNRIRKG